MNTPTKINTNNHCVVLDGDLGVFSAAFTHQRLEAGLDLIVLTLSAPAPACPPKLSLRWTHPVIDIHAMWHPNIGRNRGLSPNWSNSILTSSATQNAPVLCLHSLDGGNRLCVACSDALNTVTFNAGVVEETAEFSCALGLFSDPQAPIVRYEITVRLDTRALPYNEALKQVQEWWSSLPGMTPASVPECARLPMYSTWYSFHQNLVPSEIEAQCRLAKELGCEAVIVDDGWQNSDSKRGYASCGDWAPSAARFPNIKGHVSNVHALGMKFLLWYALPLVGKDSHAFKRFDGKLLSFDEHLGAGIFDPRFPDVRQFLTETCEHAMQAWDLDGFKLDFVDCFHPSRSTQSAREQTGGGRDFESILEAADSLLANIIQQLRRIKPAVMIEFRQRYIGPLMRKYGNMLRAGDCPNDAMANRIKTLDIRLLCGNTAAHADMLMWHPHDPVESTALQFLNVLFSVPQISVRLDKIPAQQVEMLKFWMGFWRQHRDALLDGTLQPLHPESLYPVVFASAKNKRIAVVYDESVANPGAAIPKEFLIVNATRSPRVVIEVDEHLGGRRLEIFNCQGQKIKDENRRFAIGAHSLPVPSAGLGRITP